MYLVDLLSASFLWHNRVFKFKERRQTAIDPYIFLLRFEDTSSKDVEKMKLPREWEPFFFFEWCFGEIVKMLKFYVYVFLLLLLLYYGISTYHTNSLRWPLFLLTDGIVVENNKIVVDVLIRWYLGCLVLVL